MKKIVYSLPPKIKGVRTQSIGKSISLGLFVCAILAIVLSLSIQHNKSITVNVSTERYWWGGYRPVEIATTDTSPSYGDFTREQSSKQASALFVASKTGTTWYPVECTSANRIKEENKVFFTSEEEASRAGYKKSSQCK